MNSNHVVVRRREKVGSAESRATFGKDQEHEISSSSGEDSNPHQGKEQLVIGRVKKKV
jgi:hypothetical protein